MATARSPWDAQPVLANAHLELRFWRTEGQMGHLVRNADGDELLFVHEGHGDLFCDYGHLAVRDGDVIVLPRGTMWRIEAAKPMALLLVEATGDAYRLPDRGLLGAHAFFDPAMLDLPTLDDAFRAQPQGGTWEVRIKRCRRISRYRYAFNPLDALGWKGDLVPVRINWRDLRPVTSHRYHLPPSAHTLFLANRFVVCCFVPRPFETDADALKVPFFHSNDDYDEVIFYHRGAFFSRDDIGPGMLTLHPCGVPHGPHPKALARATTPRQAMADEVAVMIDARDPLDVAPLPGGIERPGYAMSWLP